ncbi:MAG: hypothetical protein ACLFO1_06290 [Spirochaetaceae bacterium]
MQCRRATKLLFRLDNNAVRPGELREHLEDCPECRRVAHALDDAAAAVRWYAPEETQAPANALLYSAATTRRVMARIQHVRPAWADGADESPAVRLWFWLGGGILLILGAAGFRYANPYRFLAESAMGPAVDLAVTLATGIVLTLYMGLFVLGNCKRLQRFVAARHISASAHARADGA